MRIWKSLVAGGGLVPCLTLSGSFVSAAHAAPATVSVTKSVMKMKTAGFDRAVAKAHGYRIIKVNGVERSVKIGASKIRPATDTKYGNCGSSFINAYRTYKNPTVYFTTGYSVYQNVAYKSWAVSLNTLHGSGSVPFSASGTGATWHGESSYTIRGEGIAHVAALSYAVLYDGEKCLAYAPADAFSG